MIAILLEIILEIFNNMIVREFRRVFEIFLKMEFGMKG